MVANSTAAIYAPMSTIASSAVSGTYAALGNAFTQPARVFKIVNNSTEDVTVSTDGTTAMDYVPAGTFVLYDIGTNRGNSAPELCFPPVQFYVKGTGGTGNIYAVEILANSPANPGQYL